MKKAKIVNAKGGPVIVSSNLQTAFIFFVYLAWVLSSGIYFWNTGFYSNGVSMRFFAEQVLFMAFPLVLLAVSYVYTKRHKTTLNRLFIATLKTVCAYMFYGVLTSVNSQVMIMVMQNSANTPPAAFTSIWNNVILMSFTFAVFTGVLHFWMYDKKGR